MTGVLGETLANFNSQPHKEADVSSRTGIELMMYFNSQPHKEADENRVQPEEHILYFNSQPHKEADKSETQGALDIVISTHSLTRRLTRT